MAINVICYLHTDLRYHFHSFIRSSWHTQSRYYYNSKIYKYLKWQLDMNIFHQRLVNNSWIIYASESESESEIVYSIDIQRIYLQIKLHNTITHTCKSVMIYGKSTTSPKIEGRQPDSSAVTGGTPSCHNNNSGRHLRQQKPPDRWPSPSAVVGK